MAIVGRTPAMTKEIFMVVGLMELVVGGCRNGKEKNEKN